MDRAARGWGAPLVLRNRAFALVWAAGLVSQVGDWALSVGLTFYVYLLTGSALATGTTFLAAVLPQALVGAVAGVYVDRWPRRRTMIVTNLVLAAGLVPLFLVHSEAAVWIVYVVVALESAVSAFFSPAEGALLPEIVGPANLVQANSLFGTGRQIARLVGAALGGLVVGLYGLTGATTLDLASFAAAAALLVPVREPGRGPPPAVPTSAGRRSPSWRRFGAEWREGVAVSLRSRLARTLLAYTAIISVGEGIFGTLAAPFVVRILGGSGPDYGWFFSLQAVGGIAGGLLVASRVTDANPARLLATASVLFGALDGVLFTYPLFVPGIGLAFGLIVVVGLPAAGFWAAYGALQQSAVGAGFRGRYLSLLQAAGLLTMTGGALLAAFLANRIGVIPLLEVQAGVYVAGGLLVSAVMGGSSLPFRGPASSPKAPLPSGAPSVDGAVGVPPGWIDPGGGGSPRTPPDALLEGTGASRREALTSSQAPRPFVPDRAR